MSLIRLDRDAVATPFEDTIHDSFNFVEVRTCFLIAYFRGIIFDEKFHRHLLWQTGYSPQQFLLKRVGHEGIGSRPGRDLGRRGAFGAASAKMHLHAQSGSRRLAELTQSSQNRTFRSNCSVATGARRMASIVAHRQEPRRQCQEEASPDIGHPSLDLASRNPIAAMSL